MRYQVEHDLHGQVRTPDETYERELEGKWFAFARVGQLVFKNPTPFDTRFEAQRFNAVTMREGMHIS